MQALNLARNFHKFKRMKTKRASVQTESLFPDLENDRRWETKGIFSEHYLRSRLTQSHLCPKDEVARSLYDFASDLWRKRHMGLAKGPEETTRREFLEKILERLGFSFFSNPVHNCCFLIPPKTVCTPSSSPCNGKWKNFMALKGWDRSMNSDGAAELCSPLPMAPKSLTHLVRTTSVLFAPFVHPQEMYRS